MNLALYVSSPRKGSVEVAAMQTMKHTSPKESPMRHAEHVDRRTIRSAVWPLAVLLVAMAGCGSSTSPTSPTGPTGDVVAPTVSSTNPANGATGVGVITASFSEAMNVSTITTLTFAVTSDGAPVTGTVAYDASTDMASFTPAVALAYATIYTATITTGANDLAGNALAINYVWSFATSAKSSRGGGSERPPSGTP
jgi:hypothetical protein